jgi:hypothetical protein
MLSILQSKDTGYSGIIVHIYDLSYLEDRDRRIVQGQPSQKLVTPYLKIKPNVVVHMCGPSY